MAKIPLTKGLLNPSPVKVKACYSAYVYLVCTCMSTYKILLGTTDVYNIKKFSLKCTRSLNAQYSLGQ